ncbi:hypothetical protein H2201_009186, partial [Coniosporium apollinis]
MARLMRPKRAAGPTTSSQPSKRRKQAQPKRSRQAFHQPRVADTENAEEPLSKAINVEQLSSEHSSSDAPPTVEQSSLRVHGQLYYCIAALQNRKKARKKTSHIWDPSKGFEIIHAATEKKHYYCKRCLDEKHDPLYKPLIVKGNTPVLNHWIREHKTDKNGRRIREARETIDKAVEQNSQAKGKDVASIVFRVNFE